MMHTLPELPYAKNALEPFMSAETLEYHYERHHKNYVNKLNELIQGTEYEKMPLVEIISKSNGPIFNNAAQTWNHTFFWNSLTPPNGFRQPQGPLMDALTRQFGSIAMFMEQFQKTALGMFGSGWTWLVRNDANGALLIETTRNAENPLTAEKTPLLTLDAWEHAYYIDYRNERARYAQNFWEITNWAFAEQNYQLESTKRPML
jgi:superoxide dismutase, Fe-Mn family